MNIHAAKWVRCSWMVRLPFPLNQSLNTGIEEVQGACMIHTNFHHVHIVVSEEFDRGEVPSIRVNNGGDVGPSGAL